MAIPVALDVDDDVDLDSTVDLDGSEAIRGRLTPPLTSTWTSDHFVHIATMRGHPADAAFVAGLTILPMVLRTNVHGPRWALVNVTSSHRHDAGHPADAAHVMMLDVPADGPPGVNVIGKDKVNVRNGSPCSSPTPQCGPWPP